MKPRFVEKYKAKVPIKEDTCPDCGSDNLDFGDIDWHDNQFCQHIMCRECDFDFQEWYTAHFDGMTTRSKSGTHIDIIE